MLRQGRGLLLQKIWQLQAPRRGPSLAPRRIGMQVGTTQSQSLISRISVSAKVETSITRTQTGASADAVNLSVGGQIDSNYVQQVLQTELGESLANALSAAGIEGQALEDVLSGAIDLSPQATAGRIVDFATSFYGSFQSNHADEDGNAQIDGYSQLIKDAVEEGFTQSRDLLEGIGKISGQVSDDINRTYELVMQGLDDFASTQRASLTPEPAPEDVAEEPLVI